MVKKKSRLSVWINITCKAAMVVLAILGATAMLVVSVDALRIPVLNFFLTQEKRYTIIASDESEALVSRGNIDNIRSYLPKGYGVVYETYYGQGYYNLRYQNEEGQIISIRTGAGDIQLYADTENAVCEKMDMNGQPALFIHKNGLRLIMQKANSEIVLDFFAEDLDESEFFRIAILLSEM